MLKSKCANSDPEMSYQTFWAGVRYGTHNLLNLVDGGSPREQGFPQQHLCQDTAQAPHVHTFSIPMDKMHSVHSLTHVLISVFMKIH